MSTNLLPFIRFYNSNRDLFRETTAVANVAVLRNFPSQVFADPKCPKLTDRVEKALIENRVPFQIIYDSQLTDLHHYRVVVLAGCVALSDQNIKQLKRHVASGGRLCVIGPVATHDEWFRPRAKPGLQGIPADSVARFSESDDCVEAMRQSCGGRFSLSVTAPSGLCAELTEQGGRRFVHLVNYHSDARATNVVVNLVLPHGKAVRSVRLASPEHESGHDLSFEQRGDFVTFAVPQVNVYEVTIVETR